MKSISELNKKYDLELEKVISNIKKKKAKLVLLQFPDGLKPYATAVVDFLEEHTENKVEFMIWMESCFGACDTPVLGNELCTAQCTSNCRVLGQEIDFVVQFGHSELMPSY